MKGSQSSVSAALLFGCVMLTGCGPTKVTVESSPQIESYQVKSVVVLPFDRLTTPQVLEPPAPRFLEPRGAKRSDIALAIPPSTERYDNPATIVPEWAPEKVTRIFYERLSRRGDLRVISPEQARAAVEMVKDETGGLSREVIARETAQRLGADASLIGRVLVYQERAGSKWGAEPAAVGFEVKLIAPDGTILWTANYYEKQRPMNEDLIGFLGRWGFVTAEELAAYGADRMVRKFPFGRKV